MDAKQNAKMISKNIFFKLINEQNFRKTMKM